MDFNRTKQKIREKLQYGDIANLCREKNISRETYNVAMSRDSYDELRVKERLIIGAALTLIKEREQEDARVKEIAESL